MCQHPAGTKDAEMKGLVLTVQGVHNLIEHET